MLQIIGIHITEIIFIDCDLQEHPIVTRVYIKTVD